VQDNYLATLGFVVLASCRLHLSLAQTIGDYYTGNNENVADEDEAEWYK
jgi:hypothetical protein